MPSTVSFPVLMYHGLWPALDDPQALQNLWDADPQMHDPGARRYALDFRTFQQQMEQIAAFRHAPFTEWNKRLAEPPHDGLPLITFDDGHVSNATLAHPLLARLNLKAIFFITTDWIDTPGFMTAGQIRHLSDSGMLIGSHGCSHQYFSDMTNEQLREEMAQSRRKLETILGEPVQTLSLPGGRNHASIRKMARELGYRHIFTSSLAPASPNTDPLDWPRIPITQQLSPDFVPRLLKGDFRAVRAMSRAARCRGLAQRLLGNRVYDQLRSFVIRMRG